MITTNIANCNLNISRNHLKKACDLTVRTSEAEMASNYEGVEWGGHHACLEMDVGRFRFEVINPHKEALLAPE